MKDLVKQNTLTKLDEDKIKTEVIEHINFQKNKHDSIFCNFVLIPKNFGPIFQRQLFGEKPRPFSFCYKKNGEYFESHDSSYLTKVVGYDIFSKKTLEDLFLEHLPIKPKLNSMPLFSKSYIDGECNGYLDNFETMMIKYPLFYSEILNEIDSENPIICDWNLLSERFDKRIKELGFVQQYSEFKL